MEATSAPRPHRPLRGASRLPWTWRRHPAPEQASTASLGRMQTPRVDRGRATLGKYRALLKVHGQKEGPRASEPSGRWQWLCSETELPAWPLPRPQHCPKRHLVCFTNPWYALSSSFYSKGHRGPVKEDHRSPSWLVLLPLPSPGRADSGLGALNPSQGLRALPPSTRLPAAQHACPPPPPPRLSTPRRAARGWVV